MSNASRELTRVEVSSPAKEGYDRQRVKNEPPQCHTHCELLPRLPWRSRGSLHPCLSPSSPLQISDASACGVKKFKCGVT